MKHTVKENFGYEKKGRFALTGSIYMLMVAYAFSNTMIGPLMPKIIQHYQLGLGQGALIVSFQSIGGILAIVIGGLLADIFKKSRIVSIGFVLYFIGLFIVGFAPGYVLLLLAFFIIGVTRMVDTVLNAYISDLYPKKRSTYLSLLHTFYGVGAFLGPFFVRIILDRKGVWNNTYLILSFGCLILLLFFMIAVKNTSEDPSKRQTVRLKDFITLLTSKKMWLICLIMFMYSGHQNGISVWLPMYMETNLNVSPFISGLGLSVFWLGIIMGRLSASFLPNSLNGKNVIQWGSLSGGILLGLGFILKVPIILVVSAGLAGFVTGAIIPMLVAIACDWHPKNSGTASSMIFISGSAAILVFPWAIGRIAEGVGFQVGMFITSVTLICVFFLTIFLRKE